MGITTYLVLSSLLISYGDMSALPNEVIRLAKLMHTTCAREYPVDDEMIRAANYGDFAENENLKCYMKCELESLGVMSEDGEINEQGIIDILVPPQYVPLVEPMLQKCHGIKGVDNCDTAYQKNKCWQAAGPTFYLLV